MTRLLSYNILVGGTGRIDHIEKMIKSVQPDVVGLVEAWDQEVVRELARRLGMDYRTNEDSLGEWPGSLALLSRLPIVSYTVHPNTSLLKRHLLEVTLLEEDGRELTVFVTHLMAEFHRGRGGDGLRRKEVRAILKVMQAHQGPHVLMGDYNSLAPGDAMKASNLLKYLVEQEEELKRQSVATIEGHPNFASVVPAKLRWLYPLIPVVAQSKFLCRLFDGAGALYAPRYSINLLREAGYVDAFRRVHPHEWGFTCPAAAPAGRIDYMFVDPQLAERLTTCQVVVGDDSVNPPDASDHLPITAEFGLPVRVAVAGEIVEARETVGDLR
jgi:endonuclease/exonuclease/phosphatase family metal-dependent hydrolase